MGTAVGVRTFDTFDTGPEATGVTTAFVTFDIPDPPVTFTPLILPVPVTFVPVTVFTEDATFATVATGFGATHEGSAYLGCNVTTPALYFLPVGIPFAARLCLVDS